VIYCTVCEKVYNWIDHHTICDQKNFKETSEIIEEIKKLAEDCSSVIRESEKHKTILQKSKESIYKHANDIIKIINLKFYENFSKTIESFFVNIPKQNFDQNFAEIYKFIELYKPMTNATPTLVEVDDENMDHHISSSLNMNCDKRYSMGNPRKVNSNAELGINKSKFTPLYRSVAIPNNYDNYNNINDNNDNDNDETNITNNITNISSNYRHVRSDSENKCIKPIYKSVQRNLNLKVLRSTSPKRMVPVYSENKYSTRILQDCEVDMENFDLQMDEDEIKANTAIKKSPDVLRVNDNLFSKASTHKIPLLDKISQSQSITNVQAAKVELSPLTLNVRKRVESSSNIKQIVNNLTYNLNIDELNQMDTSRTKQKIIVRSDKIEIINNDSDRSEEGAGEREGKNNTNTSSKIDINFDRSNNINNMSINLNMNNINNNYNNSNTNINTNNTNISNNRISEFTTDDKSSYQSKYQSHQSQPYQSQPYQSQAYLSQAYQSTHGDILEPQTLKGLDTETLNELFKLFNKTKDSVERVNKFSSQVEFTSETIKEQLSNNFGHLSESITNSLFGLFDNITNSFTSNHRRYIISYIEGTKKIFLYDTKKNKAETKDFELSIKNRFSSSQSIEFDDSDYIFITGGKVNTGFFSIEDPGYSNQFQILKWSNAKVDASGQMPRKKAFHASLYFNAKLYIIGGAQSMGSSYRECESYNLYDKRWELMPSMNNGRSNPSICVFNNKFLYVFRGISLPDDFLDTIEFINLNNEKQGWGIFKPEDPGMTWTGGINSGVVVLNDKSILIFGGQYNKKNSNSSYIFDPIKKMIFKGNDLERFANFNSQGTIFEKSLVSIDLKNEWNKTIGMHSYNLESNSWSYIQN